MIIYIGVIILMTFLGAVASMFFKKASSGGKIWELFFDINLYVGGGLYVISALMNIWVLKYLDYTEVLPLTSITYVWTMVVSYFFLKEKITWKKIVGVMLILAGAVCIVL